MEVALPEWKDTAVMMFPELEESVRKCDTPYLLWQELLEAFEKAYGEPRNQRMINRVYQYATWCTLQPRGKTAEDDLPTCVSVCFFEHIPSHPKARADMPNWFSRDEFDYMEKVFARHATEEDLKEIRALFAA